MKKGLSLLLVLCMCITLLVACGKTEPPAETTGSTSAETTAPTEPTEKQPDTTPTVTTGTPSETTATTPAETTAPCAHSFAVTEVIRRATAFEKGEARYACSACGEEKTEALPTSIKILAIGNSFSEDAMEYLWNILDNAGIENVLLGNLFIGGCSLDMHYKYITSPFTQYQMAYTYYRNDSGKWTSEKSSVTNVLASEDWDYVTLQQVSQSSGLPNTYGSLDPLVDFLRERMPEHCQMYWHLTWAYQQNSTHSGFASYGKNQKKMYQAITKTATDVVLKNPNFDGLIPTGTMIQNLRTSYIGDTLTRDGYHLSKSLGRYAAALSWYATLTGGDPSAITWLPTGENAVDADVLPVLCEAIAASMENPLVITESAFKTKSGS